MTDNLEPSPAEMGETMTVAPGVWAPLDDLGTQIYVYGERPVDIAVQRAEADNEIRRLHLEHLTDAATAEGERIRRLLTIPFLAAFAASQTAPSRTAA